MTIPSLASSAIPAHVPHELVYDFDLFKDPGLLADPSARFIEMLAEAPPIFWSPHYGGRWFIISHEAANEAAKDTETFSSVIQSREEIEKVMAQMPPGSPQIPNPAPIGMDPPEHGDYRPVLQSYFSPASMAKLRDRIQQMAIRLIEDMKPLGKADFVQSVSMPLPVDTFLTMLGLPVEHREAYQALVKDPIDFGDPGVDNVPAKLQQIAETVRPIIMDRKENPRDDLISAIWQSRIGGREATYEDVENLVVVVFIAGQDTVKNGLGFAAIHLARNPDLQQKLRENPALIPIASEEMLRRYGFVNVARRVNRDIVFHGVELKADEIAIICYTPASLDPKAIENPEIYDLDRKSKAHLAFGTGIHRCVGMHLARIELQVVYQELLARLPPFRLDAARPPHYHGGHAIGADEIWLEWDV